MTPSKYKIFHWSRTNKFLHSNEPPNPTQQIICNDPLEYEDSKKQSCFLDYLITENEVRTAAKKIEE